MCMYLCVSELTKLILYTMQLTLSFHIFRCHQSNFSFQNMIFIRTVSPVFLMYVAILHKIVYAMVNHLCSFNALCWFAVPPPVMVWKKLET
jgi:hypothetical protein